MTARRLVWGFALLLAAAGRPAVAGTPEAGTKNFTPAPATPSYFTDERGIPYAGPQPPAISAPAAPAPAATAPAHPALAAAPPARQRAGSNARPAPAQSRAAATRALRPARPHRSRTSRLARHHRPRVWRLAHEHRAGRR
jgi:hypothetical protein